MKLKECFIVHETTEGVLLVPTGDAPFKGLVRGNKTLGAILTRLKRETTEEELLAGMKKQFDGAPEGAIERDIEKALKELRAINALEE